MKLSEARTIDVNKASEEELAEMIRVMGKAIRKRQTNLRIEAMHGAQSPALAQLEKHYPGSMRYGMPRKATYLKGGGKAQQWTNQLRSVAAYGQRWLSLGTSTVKGTREWAKNVEKVTVKRLPQYAGWSNTQKREYWKLIAKLRESDETRSYTYPSEHIQSMIEEAMTQQREEAPDISDEALAKLTPEQLEQRVKDYKAWTFTQALEGKLDLDHEGASEEVFNTVADALKKAHEAFQFYYSDPNPFDIFK